MTLRTWFVVAVNDIPKDRHIFEASFDAITEWLRSHFATQAHVIYVGDHTGDGPEQIDLNTPGSQLILPTDRGAGNNLALGMSEACKHASEDANLIVVVSNFNNVDINPLQEILRDTKSTPPNRLFMFVVGRDAPGQYHDGNIREMVLAHQHASRVRAENFDFYAMTLRRLYLMSSALSSDT